MGFLDQINFYRKEMQDIKEACVRKINQIQAERNELFSNFVSTMEESTVKSAQIGLLEQELKLAKENAEQNLEHFRKSRERYVEVMFFLKELKDDGGLDTTYKLDALIEKFRSDYEPKDLSPI